MDGTDSITLTATVTNDRNSAGVTWAVSGGGALSNTTTTTATFTAPAATSAAQTITITATSGADATKTASVSITVPAKLSVTNSSPTALNGAAGTAYSVQIQASGGIPPYKNFQVAAGSTLPACLTLNSSTGVITFTSTSVEAACAAGSPYDPAFTFQDSGTPPLTGTTPDYNIVIAPAPPLALPGPATILPATAGIGYTASVAATSGTAPLTYSFLNGTSLPAGLTLNTSTGAISGTPTTSGSTTFTIQVADTFGDIPAQQTYTLVVNAGAATHFAVAATSSTTITAGGTVNFSVTALDVDGNTATGYAGTVKFTSSDSQAVLPGNATLTSGAGSFQATLKTSGSQTIAATDTATATITGSTAAITVNAAAASKLSVSAPSTATAGTAFNVTVTAQDTYGNTVTSYAGTVQFTSTDSAAALPANSGLTSGAKTFSVTLKTSGSKTVTATDIADATITGVSSAITVSAAAASKLVVSAPATAAAGSAISVSVTAQDAYGNTATGYTGTVQFTSTDTNAALPAASTLTNGAGSFQASLKTAGVQTVTATDSVTATITGSTGLITVSPAATSKLVVSAASTATAGTAFNVTVTAEDNFGNTITNYGGTVAITSSDSSAVLPANSTLTNGVKVFSVTLKTSGSQTVTATDTGYATITGTSGTIAVSAAAATTLVVSAPATATAGTAVNVSVTAKDTYGNIATGYTGTVHFTSTDSAAVLPANSTLTSGTSTFPVTLKTSGNQTVTATDTATGTITGTTGTIAVSTAAVSNLVVSAPGTATAGTAFNVSVTAKDAYGNTVAAYTGLVHFTSTDAAATLPANTTLANGVGSFTTTLKTSGSQTVTATDTVTSTITGTTGAITVNPAAVSKLAVSAPAAVTNNVAFNFTVTAQDTYGNTVTTFADNVQFTSTDTQAVLPGASGLTNGTKSFSATLKTNGTKTITATDQSNGAISGTSGNIDVSTALIVTTNSLNPLDVGQAPSQTLAASGGSGIPADYSWSWTAQAGSSIPPGLSLSTGGVITGNPTTGGVYNVTVKVQDSGTSTNATANLTMTIYNALSLPAANSLPDGYTNVAYTGGITGSGGSGGVNVTASINSALAPANGTLAASVSGETVNITGTPQNAVSESIGVKLTDAITSYSITQSYTFSVSAPPAVTLPTPSSTLPGSATVNQAYTGSITAGGGISPNHFTWTVNNSAVPTDGSLVAIGDSLSVSNDGGNVLSISGQPTTVNTSPGVQFTAVVKDNTSGNTSGSAVTYTILVNPSGSSVGGTIFVTNYCGSNPTLPVVTITLSQGTTTIATTTTDPSTGQYSFTNIANGTYTITPTISGTGVASLFYPANYSVALSTSGNNNVTGKNFNADVTYTVSGTVSYTTGGTAQTGQVYLYLTNTGCSGNGNLGTSITNATLNGTGAFSIRGVDPGTYTLTAWMDTLGQGAQNTNDPSGSSSVTVTNASKTGATVTMTNPTFVAPSANPTIQGVIPTPTGFVIPYKPSTTSNNGNDIENATQYTVEWSTSPTLGGGTGGAQFATIAGNHTFTAAGDNTDVWILSNSNLGANTFVSGTTYYFQARAFNNANGQALHPSGWCNYTSSGCSGTTGFTGTQIGTIPCTSNCTVVSGTVTIPSSVTIASGAPLFIGIYQNSASGNGPSAIYAEEISSPVAGGSGNSYSITVPSNSSTPNQGYVLFGVLDQNKDGLIDAGDVSNAGNNNSSGFVTTGSSMTENLPACTTANLSTCMPDNDSMALTATDYQTSTQYCNGCGGTSGPYTTTSYSLSFDVEQGIKLPVAVTLVSASNPNVAVPVDLGLCASCGHQQFEFQPSLLGGTPNVGDTYTFNVTYSDSPTDTGTVTGTVTAFGSTGAIVGPSDLPTNLSPAPTTSGVGTQPAFTWTWPAAGLTSSSYEYSFYLSPTSCSGGCSDIWDVPGNNSNSNGFTYTQDQGSPYGGNSTTGSLTWGNDPSGSGSSPSPSSLTVSNSYNWQIRVQDSNQNQASASTYFTVQ